MEDIATAHLPSFSASRNIASVKLKCQSFDGLRGMFIGNEAASAKAKSRLGLERAAGAIEAGVPQGIGVPDCMDSASLLQHAHSGPNIDLGNGDRHHEPPHLVSLACPRTRLAVD